MDLVPEAKGAERVERRTFLRKTSRLLVKALGAGLGLLVLQSTDALAINCCQCCKDSSCTHCGGTPVRYRCSCPGVNCCMCHADVGMCFTTTACICGGGCAP
jgi:hypothetical protein